MSTDKELAHIQHVKDNLPAVASEIEKRFAYEGTDAGYVVLAWTRVSHGDDIGLHVQSACNVDPAALVNLLRYEADNIEDTLDKLRAQTVAH